MAGGGLSRFLGPRYFQLARIWSPTLGAFGLTTVVTGLYLTDWKVVVTYIPYYGSKFQQPKK